MLDSESVTSFLGRFTQIRDELAVVGEIVDRDFIVRITLNQCCQSMERSRASGASFSKNPWERSVPEASIIYIYI
jgi:hypothetical protein